MNRLNGAPSHPQRLACIALGVFAASVPSLFAQSAELGESQRLLLNIQRLAHQTSAQDSAGPTAIREIEKEIDSALAIIQRISAAEYCAESGVLYLSTNSSLVNDEYGSVAMLVHGYAGMQQLAFVSGTTQFSIISAINTMTGATGVAAIQSPDNIQRIELTSVLPGKAGFVAVQLIEGSVPMIFETPNGGIGQWQLLRYGRDALPGDANCDRMVDITDLHLVVDNWGDCPLPPFECVGDVTGDGAVNVNDLLRVINNWGAFDP